MCAFNPSTIKRQRQVDLCQFCHSQDYIMRPYLDDDGDRSPAPPCLFSTCSSWEGTAVFPISQVKKWAQRGLCSSKITQHFNVGMPSEATTNGHPGQMPLCFVGRRDACAHVCSLAGRWQMTTLAVVPQRLSTLPFNFFYNIIRWHGRGTCVEVRGQLIRMGSLLPPWVLGLKPRSPGLAASTLTGAILPALIFFFFNTGLEFTQ